MKLKGAGTTLGLPTEIFPQLKNNDQLKDTDYIFFMKTNKEIQNFKQGQESRKNKIDFFKFIPLILFTDLLNIEII